MNADVRALPGPVSFEVVDPGPSTTVQDAGRPGWAHLGVTRSGFLDRASARWANRLVGNDPDAALLETTAGGVTLTAVRDVVVAVTGARCEVFVAGRPAPLDEAVVVRADTLLHVGRALQGLRSYVALGGGIDAPPVLGSRSTDLLGGIGPSPLAAGDRLRVGREQPAAGARTHGLVPRDVMGATPLPHVHTLRVLPGPRIDWLDDVRVLDAVEFVAGSGSNRVGLRLEQPSVPWARRPGELPSEPMVLGAVQLPPSGDPVVFLADHPTTGGYPVVAVVVEEDLDLCARIRPGERVRFRTAG
ncbi:biotin-dependent carboxyltransferase family protein [Nocardioides yefusunii]|uniref:Biotin-dependent carboxyltransferase family protein n=1 Tax=Nocardioides yefusunii TaxID=2500546 RepID=A0ABW1QUN1_9ACTN|nr:biotin-dependent carboxyltransferase family protein [Nocardioides yefusunii]